jgi:hypothetical protein
VVVPGNIRFPRTPITRLFPGNIEGGLDDSIVAPTHYNWNLTFERELSTGTILQLSYIGRKAQEAAGIARRNVVQQPDRSAVEGRLVHGGRSAGSAAGRKARQVSSIQQIPYFANLFPANLADTLGLNPAYNQTQAVYALTVPGALGGSSCYNYGNDWTSVMWEISTLGNAACNPVQSYSRSLPYVHPAAVRNAGRVEFDWQL